MGRAGLGAALQSLGQSVPGIGASVDQSRMDLLKMEIAKRDDLRAQQAAEIKRDEEARAAQQEFERQRKIAQDQEAKDATTGALGKFSQASARFGSPVASKDVALQEMPGQAGTQDPARLGALTRQSADIKKAAEGEVLREMYPNKLSLATDMDIGASADPRAKALLGNLQVESAANVQRAKIEAETEKTKAESKTNVDKAVRDAKFDAFNAERNISKDMLANPVVKDFTVTHQNWTGIRSTWDDYVSKPEGERNKQSMGFVDQALINLFNKITDPTSVVRESEFQRTPDNIALMERVKGFLPKLTRGGVGLTDSERQALVDAAEILYLAKKEGFDRVVGGYENSVSDYSGLGIDFNRIKGTILSGDTEKAKRIGGGETNRDSLIGVARGGGSEDEIKEAREYLRSKGINW